MDNGKKKLVFQNQRLGHVGSETIIKSLPPILGGYLKVVDPNNTCRTCGRSKLLSAPREANFRQEKLTGKVLQIVHLDVFQAMKRSSIGQSGCFVNILDE